jgi:plasmid segregation protein ParM
MNVVGIDIGFGFTKASNGRESIIFKSIFGEASDIQYREQIVGGSRTEEHLHVELDGIGYFVGELAERQSNTRSFTLDQDQFVSTFARIMAMTALSHLAPRAEPVRVITGLPISYYRRHRDEVAKIITGKHEITTVDAAGKRHDTVVNVSHVRAIPQPLGTLFDRMLSDLAEVANKRYVQEKIGIIDVGFRTCDFTIADKTRYSERGSQTTESGISKAFAVIATRLREATGVNVELYRLYDAVAKGHIKIRGKRIDLKPLVEEAFKKLASSIAGESERLWADDWDIDLMLITGGGGSVLAPYLTPLLNGEVQSLEADTDNRLNNVRGYWKYGINIWGRSKSQAGTATGTGS